MAWGGLAQVIQQLCSVAATVTLARLLTEAEFGLLAAAQSVLALCTLLTTFGLGLSVISAAVADDRFLSTLHWFGCAVAGLVSIGLVGASPLLAGLFGLPEATPLLRALAPVLALNVAASVPLALLRRRMRFGAFWSVQVVAMAIYVCVQISLAVAGWGAWAVIVGQLAMAFVQLIGAFVASRWRPRLVFQLGRLRGEVPFSGGVLLGHAVNHGVKNADYWIVGNVMGAAALGSYYVAYVLPSMLRVRGTAVVGTVLIPLFARMHDDPLRTRRTYARATVYLAAIGMPTVLGIAVLADPVTHVFFGSSWQAAVEPLRWIAVAAVFDLLGSTATNLSVAHHRVARVVTVQAVRLAIFLPLAVLGAVVSGTLEAVALAVLASSAVWFLLQTWFVARPFGVGLWEVRQQIAGVCAASILMGLSVGVIEARMSASAVAQLLICVPLGMAIYMATAIPLLCMGSAERASELRALGHACAAPLSRWSLQLRGKS